MMKSIISIIIILFIFNVNKPIFKNDAIYIITRSTEFKEDFIAKDFNIIDTLSTHVGIGFAEEGKLKIYNVSNDQMLNNSALICDDYKSFTSLKSIKYISIWEKKVTTERMSYFKSILLEYKKEKIYFDFLLINFWATWCSPCIGEFPSFDKLINDKDIQKIPIKFIFSNYENIETQKKIIIKNKLDLIFCKPKDSLPKIFETNSIPTTYIIDKKNNLAYKTIGCENWNSQLIKSFLKGL